MNITIKISDTLLHDILENLPEYSISFDCTYWNYTEDIFKFTEWETGKKYTMTKSMAEKGFKLILRKLFAGELPGLSVANMSPFDAGNWDSYDTDALLQCAILGDVIYG